MLQTWFRFLGWEEPLEKAMATHSSSCLENWSELSCPPLGDLPSPGIELASPESPAVAGVFFTTEPPGKPHDTKSGVKNIYPFYFGQMASIICFSF